MEKVVGFIIILMQKPSPANAKPSFLDKFQGKKQTVNREGLLHLLNSKRQSLAQAHRQPSPVSPNKKQQKTKANKKEQVPTSRNNSPSPTKHNPIQTKKIFVSQELRQSKGSRSQRYIRREIEQEYCGEGNRFKLPIITRSQSQNRIISKQLFTPQVQMIESDRPYHRPKEASFYSKQSDRATKQMEFDQYVLRHLKFLDQFQNQFLNSRQKAPSKGDKL